MASLTKQQIREYISDASTAVFGFVKHFDTNTLEVMQMFIQKELAKRGPKPTKGEGVYGV